MEDALAAKMVVGGMVIGKMPVCDVRSVLQVEIEYVAAFDWGVFESIRSQGDMRSSLTIDCIGGINTCSLSEVQYQRLGRRQLFLLPSVWKLWKRPLPELFHFRPTTAQIHRRLESK